MTPRTTFATGINCFTGKAVGAEVKLKHPPQSAKVIADVRALHDKGVPRKVIAAKHKVSVWTVHNIINRKKCYENI